MPVGEPDSSATSAARAGAKTTEVVEGGNFLRATRFGTLGILVGTFALIKAGCRGLEVTLPDETVVPLRWSTKAGGMFTIGSVSAEDGALLRRWIYPDAVVLVVFDAHSLPREEGLSLGALDQDGQTLFTTFVPLKPQVLLQGVPRGLALAWARLPETPELQL